MAIHQILLAGGGGLTIEATAADGSADPDINVYKEADRTFAVFDASGRYRIKGGTGVLARVVGIGGGGTAGNAGGGGGAGGLGSGTYTVPDEDWHTVTIGAAGNGYAIAGSTVVTTAGGTNVFGVVLSGGGYGGAEGGHGPNNGLPGGCGGGGAWNNDQGQRSGGAGTPGQGFPGANSLGGPQRCAGGGGGVGSAGTRPIAGGAAVTVGITGSGMAFGEGGRGSAVYGGNEDGCPNSNQARSGNMPGCGSSRANPGAPSTLQKNGRFIVMCFT
jgi:hypothetical protein